MYLTRIYLNPHRRGCRYLVASLQRLHAAVLAGFPPGVLDQPGEGRVLWRLDRPAGVGSNNRALTLYVSSPVPLDPANLVEQAGYETPGGVATKRTDEFLDSLREGQVWGFRITVNPTFRRASDRGDAKRSKVLGHVTVAQQTQWLIDRAQTNGFEIPTSDQVGGDLPVLVDEDGQRVDGRNLLVGLVDRRIERFTRGHGVDASTVTLQLATFEGTLRVTDPNALRAALVNGIGRAKGYGAGLLTLARA